MTAPKKLQLVAAMTATGADGTGIIISLPDLTPGALNTVSAPGAPFVGRAVLIPGKNGVPGVNYLFIAYVTRSAGAAQIFIPDVTDVLFADLPNGVLAPAGYATIFDALNYACNTQTGPTDPTGTGNDKPGK